MEKIDHYIVQNRGNTSITFSERGNEVTVLPHNEYIAKEVTEIEGQNYTHLYTEPVMVEVEEPEIIVEEVVEELPVEVEIKKEVKKRGKMSKRSSTKTRKRKARN